MPLTPIGSTSHVRRETSFSQLWTKPYEWLKEPLRGLVQAQILILPLSSLESSKLIKMIRRFTITLRSRQRAPTGQIRRRRTGLEVRIFSVTVFSSTHLRPHESASIRPSTHSYFIHLLTSARYTIRNRLGLEPNK